MKKQYDTRYTPEWPGLYKIHAPTNFIDRVRLHRVHRTIVGLDRCLRLLDDRLRPDNQFFPSLTDANVLGKNYSDNGQLNLLGLFKIGLDSTVRFERSDQGELSVQSYRKLMPDSQVTHVLNYRLGQRAESDTTNRASHPSVKMALDYGPRRIENRFFELANLFDDSPEAPQLYLGLVSNVRAVGRVVSRELIA